MKRNQCSPRILVFVKFARTVNPPEAWNHAWAAPPGGTGGQVPRYRKLAGYSTLLSSVRLEVRSVVVYTYHSSHLLDCCLVYSNFIFLSYFSLIKRLTGKSDSSANSLLSMHSAARPHCCEVSAVRGRSARPSASPL